MCGIDPHTPLVNWGYKCVGRKVARIFPMDQYGTHGTCRTLPRVENKNVKMEIGFALTFQVVTS